ncbi:MFS transporter [Cellulomonas bogoriensis]|uniref:MFS transporter n=1 Tax=Cellulomonas bogoriensis 69B4 = DSM 16987 TaxID=1386082 RepID=A0A0A0C1A8_9CELL|nr:MFS transporter [Cellulomonas bogoriensis]KGM14001.1 MFS transporter [Cellulomonas bogoriensis 69B4 = DSM 16987]
MTTSPVSPVPPAPRPRSLLRHRDFRRLWAGDAFGQLGAGLTGLVLPVYAVQHLHADEWQMGALTAAETAAFLLIGLPAGAWVDRMRRRQVLITADLVRAAVLAVVVALALSGQASMTLLYGAALALSAATVFFDVAHQSYVPGLVGLDRVSEGNAKLQATHSVAQVAAPALGGALLRVVAAPLLIAFTVLTYLVSAAWIGRIRHREEPPSRSARRPLRLEIAEGLGFVLRHRLLRRVVACTSIGNLFGAMGSAMTVLYAMRTLGLDERALGAVLSAGAIGGLVGALAAEPCARLLGQARVIPLAALAMAPAYALTPAAAAWADHLPAQATLAAGGAVFSFFVVVYNIAQVSFRQRLCPPALLGRMNASVRFLVWGTLPVGALTGGWLGATAGVVPTLWVAVTGTALAALPVALSPLMRMRDLPTGRTHPEPVP